MPLRCLPMCVGVRVVRGTFDRLSDESLAVRASRGDESAYAALYGRHVGDLADFATWVVRDRELAAEVVARTFSRVWDRLQAGVTVDTVRAWLYATTQDEALTVGRIHDAADADRIDLFAAVDASRLPTAQAVPLGRELVALVCDSARTLSPRDYSLLDLHLRRKLSATDLASVLGLDRAAVSFRLSRLLVALEAPVTANVLARQGRDNCGALDALLGAVEGAPACDVRAAIRRHSRGCAVCQEFMRHFAAPEEIFATLATIFPSERFSATIWERVSQHVATRREAARARDLDARLSATTGWRRRPSRAFAAGTAVAIVGVGAAVTALVAVIESSPSSSRSTGGTATIASRSPGSAFLPPLQPAPSVTRSAVAAPDDNVASPASSTPSDPRTFAWARVEGAAAYQLSLFRDDAIVFSARTREASLVLPSTWRYEGRAQRLRPGTYRWYVWPIMKGSDTLAREANVSSLLIVR